MILLLRFSDREADSIREHRKILQREGCVWWGWWKKVHESFPPAGVLPTPGDGPVEVGLFRRKPDEAFFVATCDRVVHLDGEEIDCPRRDQCPAYYHDDRFPAWFRFTAIHDASAKDWTRRFGEVPEPDNTLYWIDADGNLLPELQPPTATETDHSGILHLSDLHFGSMHAFKAGWGDGHSMVERVVEYIARNAVSVGIVVASGDFISAFEGPAQTFSFAHEQLGVLLEKLDLGPEQLVLVPGNHDISLAEAAGTGTRRYKFEAPYREFVNQIRGGEVEEIESLTYFDTADQDLRIAVVGLNSVRLRDEETREYGYVGHRSAPWFRRIREDRPKNGGRRELNLVVLHHHLLPATKEAPPKTPVSVTVDAAKITEDCHAAGIHAVLHGHQHYPFASSVGRVIKDEGDTHGAPPPPLWVLGAGSAGSVDLTGDLPWNSFSVYVPQEEILGVTITQFNEQHAATPYLEVELPLV